jgi:hypothetical protein
MKKKYNLFILFSFLFLLSCQAKEDTSQQQPKFTDMTEYIEFKCTMCHFSDRIFKQKRKREEWAKIIPRMRNRNRQWITAEDERKLLDYFFAERSISGEGDTKTGETDIGMK